MIKTELKLDNGIIISTESSDPTKSRESISVSLSDETLKMVLKMKQEIETLLNKWMKGSDGYKKIPNSPITGFYATEVTFSNSKEKIGLGIELSFDTNVVEKWKTLFEEIKKLDIIKAIETILKKYLKNYQKPMFIGSDYPLSRYDGEAHVFWEFTTKSSLTVDNISGKRYAEKYIKTLSELLKTINVNLNNASNKLNPFISNIKKIDSSGLFNGNEGICYFDICFTNDFWKKALNSESEDEKIYDFEEWLNKIVDEKCKDVIQKNNKYHLELEDINDRPIRYNSPEITIYIKSA